MRVLGVDPGAVRCGWACLEKKSDPVAIGSGILGLTRNEKETFQSYKLRLIQYWTKEGEALLDKYKPDQVVCEIIPAVGGGNFVVATQSHLAATVATVILSTGMRHSIPVSQVSANTVKRRIGGKRNASKAIVRKGVYKLMPNMEVKEEWKKVSDESDAYAIALCELGYNG